MDMYQNAKVDPAQIPKLELRVLCAAVLEGVMRFYEIPENVEGFERWIAEREGGEDDGQKACGEAPAGIPESCAG